MGVSDSPRVLTPAQLLAPTILGFYFTLDGIFGIIPYYVEKTRRSIKPLKSSRLSLEEKYYYNGKTNQQLRQYHEALQCYKKALKNL
jgi:hypothetical protein